MTARSSSVVAVLMVFGLLLATAAMAQPNRPLLDPAAAQQRMAAEIESVIELLDLEGEDADTVRAVLTVRNEKMTKAREKLRAARGDRTQMGQMREFLAAIEEETNAALAELLTEEQMKQYVEFRASRRGNRPRGPR